MLTSKNPFSNRGQRTNLDQVADEHAGKAAAHQPCRRAARRQIGRRRASRPATALLLCAVSLLAFGWQSAVAAAAGSPSTGVSSGTTSTSSEGTSTSGAGSSSSSSTTSPNSTSGSVSPSQSQINATEAQVASLETQISKEQNSLDQADEQYNEAVVNLTSTRSSLQTTSSSIAVIKTKLTTERTHLRDDAIQAYIGDTSSEAVAQIFAAPNNQSQINDLYQEIGAGNIARDVAEVQANQAALSDTRSKLLAEQKTETAQATQEDKTRQSAAAASAASEATLTQVQGTLAQQIAQQAAAQAAAAAQTASSATTPSAAQAAASQAAQASDVASTLSGGSAAADSAAAAASQAAGSAGGANFGYGGSPTAAGLAAVHGAMKYLGVPYVWGGSSYGGVDCSGLTMLAWAQAGVSMPHSAADQYADFPHVSADALEPGDLLFYDFGGGTIDHVVMYVGPTLDGQATPYGGATIIQAAHTGTVVTFDPVFAEGFVGAAQP